MGNEELPSVNKFAYDCTHLKDKVPGANEKPIMGLRSNKNFIITNAIENILSTAKRAPEQENWLKKKDYGQTPEYIQQVKENINNEYKMIQKLHEENQPKQPYLTEEQVSNLRQGLKRKWNEINQEYQKKTYIKLVDTYGSKTRKQNYEKQLAEIEADIKKLNKGYVFVEE